MIQEETSSSRIVSHSGTQIETLDTVRSKLVNAAIFAIAIMGLPIFIATLFRMADVGWQPLIFLHFGAYLVVVGTTILHRQLSFSIRTFVVLGGLLLSGTCALLIWGLIGMGIVFFVTCSILATIFLGTRAGIVMMDMRMPVMDGYEATRRIRELATRNSQLVTRILIIALTISAFEEDRARILSAGCDAVVKKPVRETELFEIIRKHIGVRYVYEESHKSNIERRKSKVKDVLMPEVLAALPNAVLMRLEQATERSDVQLVLNIIEEIRSYNSALADVLAYLANEFDYDEILRLIEQAKRSV